MYARAGLSFVKITIDFLFIPYPRWRVEDNEHLHQAVEVNGIYFCWVCALDARATDRKLDHHFRRQVKGAFAVERRDAEVEL